MFETPLGQRFAHWLTFVLLLTFSIQQIAFASPMGFVAEELNQEPSFIRSRASSLSSIRATLQAEELRLEDRHLEGVAQRTFRRLLGRDPAEEKERKR